MASRRNNGDSGRNLTPKQLAALPFLAQGRSIEDGCRRAKIAKQTFYTWQKDEVFMAAYEETRRDILDNAIKTLESFAVRAAEVLSALLGTENETLRRGVANDILDRVTRHRELTDVVTRLERLETQISDHQAPRRAWN